MLVLVAGRHFSQPLFDGVNRLATSAYKPARLGKSLLFRLSQRSGQTYPLVADRVDLRPLYILHLFLVLVGLVDESAA